MQSVLLSIRPKYAKQIVSGEKTVEIRKRFPVNIRPPFVVYLYCTLGKEKLIGIIRDGDEIYGSTYHGPPEFIKIPEEGYGNSFFHKTIFGKCICESIERLYVDLPTRRIYKQPAYGDSLLSIEDLNSYANGGPLFGWHITEYKQLIPFLELKDFGMKRPPQSWCYIKEGETWNK